MAIPKRYVRTSSDIPSMSGKSSQGAEPHKLFMRITCLEMEKARRGKERESAMFRVNSIDMRVREIDEEKESLLQMVEELQQQVRGTSPSPEGADPTPFKIQY